MVPGFGSHRSSHLHSIDEEGNFVHWNKYFEEMSGYSDHEISRMKPTDFFDESDREAVTSKIQEAFTQGQSFLFDSPSVMP